MVVNEATYASGIFTSAKTFANMLQDEGVNVKFNGSFKDKYDIYHFHSATPSDFFRLRALKKSGQITIAHGHTTPEDFYNSFLFSHYNWIISAVRKYLRSFYNIPNTVIAVSPYNQEILVRNGVSQDQIVVIPNGIFIEKFSTSEKRAQEFRKFFGIPNSMPIALTVGLWLPRKGITDFMKTAALNRKICFLWAGKIYPPGVLANSFSLWKKLHSANRSPNLRFLNWVPDIVGAFSAADIFFYPTKEENQGIALLEAIAYGLPCVVRNIDVFEWLNHGNDCFKGNNPKEFDLYIRTLLDDVSKQNQFISSTKSKINQFDMKEVIKQLLQVYTDTLDRRS